MTRFQFVADHSTRYGVKRLCRVLGVARSSFYHWRSAAPARAERADADARLAQRIRQVHADFDGTYGVPRVTAELRVLGSGHISHFVNGEEVLDYALPQIGGGQIDHYDPKEFVSGKLLDHGYIALQAESHPIDYRKVELLNLEGCMDKAATNYKSYHVKSAPATCRYSSTERSE